MYCRQLCRCTACMIVSLLTTCMNFNTPPLAQVAPFRCKIRESNAEVTLAQNSANTSASRLWSVQLNVSKPGQLHLDHSRVSKRPSRLVYKHSMVPTKCLLSLSSSRVIGLFKKFFAKQGDSVSSLNFRIACCSCSLLLLPDLLCSLLFSLLFSLLCSLLS